MTPVEAAWAAGLLEGEGHFLLSWAKRSTIGPYPTLRLQMNQTDEDVVRKLADLAGGHIYGPFAQTGIGVKPVWRWELGRRDAVLAVLAEIRPHMGRRRGAKIDEMIRVDRERARPKWRHGTRQGYERGCRLECCRLPHNARMRDQRARRAA